MKKQTLAYIAVMLPLLLTDAVGGEIPDDWFYARPQFQAVAFPQLPPNGFQLFEKEMGQRWVDIDVTEHGLKPDDRNIDSGNLLESILEKFQAIEKLRLIFPAGTFYFSTGCRVTRGNIWLRGAGPDQTKFLCLEPRITLLQFGKESANSPVQVTRDIQRGEKEIEIAEVRDLVVGDFVMVYYEQPGITSSHVQGAVPKKFKVSQIVQITNMQDRRLTCDMRLGLNMTIGKNVAIEKLNMTNNVVLEGLHLEKTKGSADPKKYSFHHVQLTQVQNGLIRECELSRVEGGGVNVVRSRNVCIENNYIHDLFNPKFRGNGNGIMFTAGTTMGLAINNRLRNLRHHLWLGHQANHCVVAYNTTDKSTHYSDVNVHGNYAHNLLFEGNDGYDITAHNFPECYYLTYYRNRAANDLGVPTFQVKNQTPHRFVLLLGNETRELHTQALDVVAGANLVNGTLQMDNFHSEVSTLPASLFLSSKPNYVTNWPLFGPGK